MLGIANPANLDLLGPDGGDMLPGGELMAWILVAAEVVHRLFERQRNQATDPLSQSAPERGEPACGASCSA